MRALLITVALVATSTFAGAQGFDSTSNGSDGALTFAAGAGVIVFDPSTAGPGGTALDADGDNVFHFTTIDIPAGTTVKLIASLHRGEGRSVTWLASGDVSIEGDIDLSGAIGHTDLGPRIPSEPGAGGWSGGSNDGTIRQPGNGPGGGFVPPGNANGGSHRTAGITAGGNPASPTYGNRYLIPLVGGSGGGAGGSSGGGAGGGALLIASSGTLTLNGTINAQGGPSPSLSTRGGGGSGGAIRLMATSLAGTGECNVNGGTVPFGNAGGTGWVRLQAFTNTLRLNGTFTPLLAMTAASPGIVFPPANAATVRVSSVDGINAPAMPTGSFDPVDVTIDNPAAVTIALEGTDIPLGTEITVQIFSEDGTSQLLTSTPLAGSVGASTATVSATLPTGFSRISVFASW